MGVDGSPGVVGRRAERDAGLRGAVSRGLSGTPALAIVVGEPGIGKSTLVAQVAAEVRAGGTRVVYEDCAPTTRRSGSWLAHLRARAVLEPVSLEDVGSPVRRG